MAANGTKIVTMVDGLATDSPLRFISFIAIWLAKHVFLGSLEDGMSIRHFRLVIHIAKGQKLPLGPLYAHLDEFKSAYERSIGRCRMNTFVDAFFLQLLM